MSVKVITRGISPAEGRSPFGHVGRSIGRTGNSLRRGTRRLLATYGPNLLPGGAWTMTGTTPGVDNGDGSMTFTGASNSAIASKPVTLEDNTTYLVTFTMAWTSGSVKSQTYGATLAHAGSITTRATSGTFSEEVTTSAAGSFTNLFRFQTNGVSGTNSYTISNVSLKKKLT